MCGGDPFAKVAKRLAVIGHARIVQRPALVAGDVV
jgi:hypothetical protein